MLQILKTIWNAIKLSFSSIKRKIELGGLPAVFYMIAMILLFFSEYAIFIALGLSIADACLAIYDGQDYSISFIYLLSGISVLLIDNSLFYFALPNLLISVYKGMSLESEPAVAA